MRVSGEKANEKATVCQNDLISTLGNADLCDSQCRAMEGFESKDGDQRLDSIR